MFGKMNIKTLVIIFGALLLVVVLLQWFQRSGTDRNFRNDLVEADSAKITEITIIPKGQKEALKLEKTEKGWILKYRAGTYIAEKSSVDAILSGLQQLIPERMAADSEDNWKEYEVTDSLGVRIKVEEKGEELANIIIGKFTYNQNSQTITTYIRVAGDDEVYAVNGFFAMNFGQSFNTLRNKALGPGIPADINKLTFTYPSDSSFILMKQGAGWNISGQVADSMSVVNYIQNLTDLRGTEFTDDNATTGNPSMTITAGGNGGNIFVIKAFPIDSAGVYIVTSSVNPGAKFLEKNDGLLARVFVSKKNFFKKK
ncbi:MAG: DUF4340 domain-containing protein [Bacteroidetes bacterium]|nr:DUF4340 domain-containing protein [Bacteroidota bacterium]